MNSILLSPNLTTVAIKYLQLVTKTNHNILLIHQGFTLAEFISVQLPPKAVYANSTSGQDMSIPTYHPG